MYLDVVLLGQLVLHDKGRHVLTLITLQLQHLAGFFVFHDAAVAAVLLLQRLQNLLQVELFRQTLHGRQRLLSILRASKRASDAASQVRELGRARTGRRFNFKTYTLLHTDMNSPGCL